MFWFRLAGSLGMSVARAQREIDSRELTEWMAYDRLNPLGNEQMVLLLAKLYVYVRNKFRGKSEPAVAIKDVLPQIAEIDRNTTPDPEIVWRKLGTALGRASKRNKK